MIFSIHFSFLLFFQYSLRKTRRKFRKLSSQSNFNFIHYLFLYIQHESRLNINRNWFCSSVLIDSSNRITFQFPISRKTDTSYNDIDRKFSRIITLVATSFPSHQSLWLMNETGVTGSRRAIVSKFLTRYRPSFRETDNTANPGQTLRYLDPDRDW